MSAKLLIDLLEEQGLLDPAVIVELRRNVAQSKTRITIESLAKLLVDNGQLSRFQAIRIVSQIKDGNRDDTSTRQSAAASDDLDLLPDEPTEANADPNQTAASKKNPDDPIVNAVEVVEATPFDLSHEPSTEGEVAKKRKKKQSHDKASSWRKNQEFETSGDSTTLLKPVKIAVSKGNSWDAFRIWGVGFILSVLLAALSWLVYWVMSGSSAEYYEQAQAAYESREYEVAVERFNNFAKKFPKEDKASAARSFAAIATIRHASDQLGDPARAIDLAEAVLPKIVNEPSMSDTGIRSDLASALVSVAEKLLQRADNAKTTADRKELINKLDKHLVLMRNPQYIPNANRITNESRIKSFEENRERILRDVQRAEDLVSATQKMKEAIEGVDVEAAYQARRTVTRKYPQLALDPELLALLKQATTLQQKAVKTAEAGPKLVDLKTDLQIGRSILLYKRSGSDANVAPDLMLYIKAKGSIYGLRGTDGQVFWRRNVGIENVSEPIRLSSDPSADCLMVIPSQHRMARLSAQDGTTLWEVDFGNTILHPSVDGDTIYVATADGRAFAVDATTGQAKWSKQVPQKLNVGIGGGSARRRDTLSAIIRTSTFSLATTVRVPESTIGHSAGTIAIPPVYALGQLIVFQNVTAGSCEVRLLRASDESGASLEVAQASIPPLKGHVVVPPSLDGRRLVVITDLGETIAYDVEPASTSDKLNRVANIVANETQPRIAWPLVVGNELWIASNRFSRFQIQVSKQKLVPQWVRDDEDQFTSRPFKMDDYIVHTRVVRGTQGVRVTATNAETGDPVWETDLGVPIVALQSLATGGLAAISSQAALYAIDAPMLAAGKPLNASENPGRNQRLMQFSDPTLLPNGRTVMLNTHQGTHVAIFDPSASPGASLLVNRLQITGGLPSTEPLAVGQALVIPLDNSQLAYIDPTNGKSLGAPFQPTLAVGVNTQWLTPALLADQQTVVAATDQKTLFRLSSGKQLKELTQATTATRWVQRLAAIGDTICGVARGDAQDALQFYKGTDLTRIEEAEVDGRVTWGPYALGERFLAHSETSGIVAYDKSGKALWKTPLAQVALVGPAVLQGEDILFSSTAGSMFRIVAETGKLRAETKIGEPLSGAPFILGNALLFPGNEGVLIAVPASKTQASSAEVDAL